MSRLDPAESKGDRINQRKNYLGDRIMIVALGEKDVSAEKRFQLQALQKEMQEINATEVGYSLPGERNFEIFGAKTHLN